ncbi:hypothetical protein OG330_17925 [Streptomyces albidoflavus]|nr:hypothetical protein OG330_17925 [Streptomyces albidoflavus]WTD98123.1 hypothetical protein OG950_17920 [Streptomyces albidoflavus]
MASSSQPVAQASSKVRDKVRSHGPCAAQSRTGGSSSGKKAYSR